MSRKPNQTPVAAQLPEAQVEDNTVVNGDDDESGRSAVAWRRYFKDDGTETRNPAESVGFEYELRNGGGKFRMRYDEMPIWMLHGLAGFGATTQAGNQINTRYPKKTGASKNAKIDAVVEWFEYTRTHENEFGPPREGGGGQRINIERLKQALRNYAAKKGGTADKAIARLDSGDAEAPAYYYKNAEVKAEYVLLGDTAKDAAGDADLLD